MIAMSYMDVMSSGHDEISVEYKSVRQSGGMTLPAVVWVDLEGGRGRAHLALSIEHARILAERLPRLLMLHDAAERLAAEMAVDSENTDSAEQSGQAAA
ncbi:hypothetical protein [Nocardia sp. CA-119907]|uniref:hypothetical protein n=1 Tax=Nocardia sp. CA-119907 TaxID=3239973 RepID=UPI003D990F8E